MISLPSEVNGLKAIPRSDVGGGVCGIETWLGKAKKTTGFVAIVTCEGPA